MYRSQQQKGLDSIQIQGRVARVDTVSPAASTCVEACPGAQGGAQVLHHLSHQLSLPEVRGPHLQYSTVQYSTVQYSTVQ